MPAIVSLIRARRTDASPASATALLARCSRALRKNAAKRIDVSRTAVTTTRTRSCMRGQNTAKARGRERLISTRPYGCGAFNLFQLPADSDTRRPGDARVGAAVVGAIVHVGNLYAGLQFQPVTVEIVICADIHLVVLVAPACDHASFVSRELDAVRIVAVEKRVPADELQLVRHVDVGHRHHAPEIALAKVPGCGRDIGPYAPALGIKLEVHRQDVLQLPGERVVWVLILVDPVGREQRFSSAERFREIVADDGKRRRAAVELPELLVRGAGGIHTQPIDPRRRSS